MKIYNKFLVFGLMLFFALGFTNNAFAMTPTLSVSNNGNNTVFISVYGDSNTNINLYYNNGYGLQSTYLGTTNYNGYFSTSLNTSSYNITQGTSVYVMVNNQQSSSVLWPTNYYQNNNYTNSGLNVSSLTLPVGSNGVYVSSNSNAGVVNVNNSNGGINSMIGCNTYNQYSTITGQPCYMSQNTNYNYNSNSVVIYASTVGYSTLTICSNGNSGVCNTLNVNVINNNVISNGSVLGVSTVSNSCTLYRTLRYGMYGNDVSCLKQLLANKGYLVNNNYDNYFDYDTRNAVLLFQQDHYLGTDGTVGSRTRNYLY
jgi:peptidoglycan hydrolase-like protein with peptidoglycan-binding domain